MNNFRLHTNLEQNNVQTQMNSDYHESNYSQNPVNVQNFQIQIVPNQDIEMNDIEEIISPNRENHQILESNSVIASSLFSGSVISQNIVYDQPIFGTAQITPFGINERDAISRVRQEYDLETRPHLILSLHKLNPVINEKELERVFTLTPYGLVDSSRIMSDNQIKIGRMMLDEEGEVYNDIIIPSDRSISRCHCKIDFSKSFKEYRIIPDNYVAFLMMNHRRLGRYLNVPHLPTYALYNILSYLPEKLETSILDAGSMLGTYVKLKFNQPYPVDKGQIFLVGNEYVIIIKEIKNLVNEDLMNLSLYDSGQVLGIPKENTQITEFYYSYILIEVSNLMSVEPSVLYYVFAKESLTHFKIGRVSSSDIIIQNTTISRDQALLSYNHMTHTWYIQDGSTQKKSLNGTWISLSTVGDKINRRESQKFKITHGDEIKISDYYITVEEKNMDKYYN